MMAKGSRNPTTHFCNTRTFSLGFIAVLEIIFLWFDCRGWTRRQNRRGLGTRARASRGHLVWLLLKSDRSSSGYKIHSSFPVKFWFQNADLLYNVSFDSFVVICFTSDWVSGLAVDQ